MLIELHDHVIFKFCQSNLNEHVEQLRAVTSTQYSMPLFYTSRQFISDVVEEAEEGMLQVAQEPEHRGTSSRCKQLAISSLDTKSLGRASGVLL